MHLLSIAGRRALLDFLRNLTPQVLLLSSAMYFYAQWHMHGGFLDAVFCAGLFFIGVLAAFANMDAFLDDAFSQSKWVATERDKLKEQGDPGLFRRIWRLVGLIAKHKPITLLEFAIALIIIYGASIALVRTAAAAAIAALR